MPVYATNRRKDGKTQYRVRINYTDPSGAHLQKEGSCYGHQEALELERKLLLQYAFRSISDAEMPLSELCEQYMKEKGTEVRETTLAKSEQYIRLHIMPELGQVRICDLNERIFAEWKAGMLEKNLSTVYCRHIWSELSCMLNWAVRMRYIPENPTKNLNNFRDSNFTSVKNDLHFYTPEQFSRFAETANKSVENYMQRSVYVFLMIAYYTGLRKGEIHALRWADIQGDILHVRHSISQKIKGKSALETSPKTKSSIRDLQIPHPLLDILRQYMVLQQLQFGKDWSKKYYVCYGPKCISDTTLANYNEKWARQAGLPALRIHDYRHSHASLLANEGINIQEIARRLGHTNVQITWQRYSHLYPREQERALSVLDKVEIPELSPNLQQKCKDEK